MTWPALSTGNIINHRNCDDEESYQFEKKPTNTLKNRTHHPVQSGSIYISGKALAFGASPAD